MLCVSAGQDSERIRFNYHVATEMLGVREHRSSHDTLRFYRVRVNSKTFRPRCSISSKFRRSRFLSLSPSLDGSSRRRSESEWEKSRRVRVFQRNSERQSRGTARRNRRKERGAEREKEKVEHVREGTPVTRFWRSASDKGTVCICTASLVYSPWKYDVI